MQGVGFTGVENILLAAALRQFGGYAGVNRNAVAFNQYRRRNLFTAGVL